MGDDKWQRARLFPVTGIGNPNEQERRGCSVLLAILSSVKEFGRALTARFDAPAGKIETFIEVPFDLGSKGCRPDGLIRVSRGRRTWTALVEVKTGRNDLDPEQCSMYLDVAREHGFDAVVTISHQIATTPGVHPVTVDGGKLGVLPSSTFRGAESTLKRSFSTQTTRLQTPTRLGCFPSSSDTSRIQSLEPLTLRTWVPLGLPCAMEPHTRPCEQTIREFYR